MLDINWVSTEWPTEYKDGYGDIPLPLSGLAETRSGEKRPFFVFIDEDREPEEEEDLIQTLFGLEDVVIASRAFNCFRLTAEDIPDRTLRKKYGKKTPALYFFTAEGKEIGKVSGKSKAKSVYSKMRKPFEAHYDAKLSKWVKSFLEGLTVMEKAEDDVANMGRALSSIEERLAKKDKLTSKHKKDLADAKQKVAEAEKAFEAAKKKVEDLLEIPTKEEKKDVAKR
jgi:hypothetical protein